VLFKTFKATRTLQPLFYIPLTISLLNVL